MSNDYFSDKSIVMEQSPSIPNDKRCFSPSFRRAVDPSIRHLRASVDVKVGFNST